jgi:Mycothiol maleylpyruvate isomerase N-terminal domain
MAGIRATLGDVSGLIGALDDGEWATASAAAGWTVKDVVTHFGDLLGILASAIGGTLSTDLGIERLNDAHIAAKSSWSPGQVVADLERQQAALLPQLESLQEEPTASAQAQLLDLGRYPLHAIPDMFSFDFYTHLRWDVLAPRGPLTGHDVPATDEVRLKPAVGWLLAGIPKMQAGIRDSLAKPVTLALTGPGGGAWLLDPDTELISVTATDPENAAAARIESTTHAFTAWASTRLPWRDHVTVTGDESIAATFLDALNLV